MDNERHDVRVDGAGVSGAVGYVFRDGVLSNAFGSNARLEIGGSYQKANGHSSTTASYFDVDILRVNLNGQVSGVNDCAGVNCSTTSKLATDHTYWNLFLSGKSDFKAGLLTLTPAFSVFGGKGRTGHSLAQTYFYTDLPRAIYGMQSVLDWNGDPRPGSPSRMTASTPAWPAWEPVRAMLR